MDQGSEEREQAASDVDIGADLQDEFMSFPGRRDYWGARYADSCYEVYELEAGAKRQEARAYLSWSEATPRPTVDAIKARVRLDREVVQAEGLLNLALRRRDRLRQVVESMQAKREMLVSLGAHERAALEGDPMIRRRDEKPRAPREDLSTLEERAGVDADW